MIRSLIILAAVGFVFTGCSKLEETQQALECNRYAVMRSTQAVNENAQAVEEANHAIADNVRALQKINQALQNVGKE